MKEQATATVSIYLCEKHKHPPYANKEPRGKECWAATEKRCSVDFCTKLSATRLEVPIRLDYDREYMP